MGPFKTGSNRFNSSVPQMPQKNTNEKRSHLDSIHLVKIKLN